MTLRTVQVPAPPPGEDFSTTVPGRYLYDVIGLTAILTTAGPTSVMVDSSGNANDATYQFSIPPNAADHLYQPGLVAGGHSLRIQALATPADVAVGVQAGDVPVSFTGDWTIECLVQVDAGETNFTVPYVQSGGGVEGFIEFSAGSDVEVVGFGSITWIYADAPIYDGAVHHVACTNVLATNTRTLYIDGTPLAVTSAGSGGPGQAVSQLFTSSSLYLAGLLDELAVYQTVLSPASIAAHVAAIGAGQAAYTAAVLADGPQEYFHFDDQAGGVDQAVTLEVVEAGDVVEQIPTGANVVPGAGVYAFSWQTQLSSGAQIPSGSHTTVAIPRLALPAGYTIRSHTYGLGATDQWANVVLWWDDDLMTLLDPLADYRFPGGIRLHYARRGVSP